MTIGIVITVVLGMIIGGVYRVTRTTEQTIELWDATPDNNEPIYGEIGPLPPGIVFNIPDVVYDNPPAKPELYETPIAMNELYYSPGNDDTVAVYDVATATIYDNANSDT